MCQPDKVSNVPYRMANPQQQARDNIREAKHQAETYDFVMHKDWWDINDLELASPTDPTPSYLHRNHSLFMFSDNMFCLLSHVLIDCSLFGSGFTSLFVVAT